MRFRAGFRRVNVATPTEYQLQYCWKTPTNGSPLLSAENVFHREREREKRRESEQGIGDFEATVPGQNGRRDSSSRNERPRTAVLSSRQHRTEAMQDRSERNGLEGGQRNGEEEGGEGESREIQPPVQPVGTTNPTPQPKKKKKKKTSKHPSLSALRLVSEYQMQFKSWPIAPNPPAGGGHARSTDGEIGVVCGGYKTKSRL